MGKFIQIKRAFLKDFCYFNGKSGNDNPNLMQFNFNKFCSFGTYFFNNLKTMIDDLNIKQINNPLSLTKGCYNQHKLFQMKRMTIPIWMDYISSKEENKNLDKFFCVFFNSKLISWKTCILNTKSEKENTCRVCDKILSSKDFILHSWFCKEIKFYLPKLTKLNEEIDKLLEKIEKNKIDIYQRDNIFDKFYNLDIKINNFTEHSRFNIMDKIVKY